MAICMIQYEWGPGPYGVAMWNIVLRRIIVLEKDTCFLIEGLREIGQI